ncbi:beta-1,4-mannosyltransferase [Dendrobium catenatum]|uniref:Beta-1,4-mannosyltransferase n=1 Tax=Dendrobium catenatum TaxID=906689 RepID=A0A2I0XGE7_9ASPA|nr:beta-1,4-mannosyltransferase [Dendrobium catenatum]
MIIHAESVSPTVEATIWTQNPTIPMLNLAVQMPTNPPSVPTLVAVKLSSLLWLGRCGFVIDWHNTGYTLLGMSHGSNHIIVKLSKWFEKYFAKTANSSLCVTELMQQWLAHDWGVKLNSATPASNQSSNAGKRSIASNQSSNAATQFANYID